MDYVDDTTVLFRRSKDLRKVGELVERFGRATGMTINRESLCL